MQRLSGRLLAAAAIDPEERDLAGRLCGALFTLGGATFLTFPLLPGLDRLHIAWLLIVGGAALVLGLLQILAIPWKQAPWWLIHVSLAVSLILIAGAMAASGGVWSQAWVYVFFTIVFAGYFFPARVASFYLAGAVGIHLLPLVYSSGAGASHFFATFTVAAPAYLTFGAALVAGKDRTVRLRARAEELAATQSALRQVATAVVGGHPPSYIYDLAARELSTLWGGGAAGLLRREPDDNMLVLGSYSSQPGRYAPGSLLPVRPGSDLERVLATGRAVRIANHEPGSPVRELGFGSSIVSPVSVKGRVWGVVAVTAAAGALTEADTLAVAEFGDLLATAIVSLEDRAKLAAQASSDPLTGLANHRTLQDRLAMEVSRAARHNLPLSVAVLDVDQFKLINDIGGHGAGDAMLLGVANCLREQARSEDVLGRVGGDEFAWVMPETTREQALSAVERTRAAITRAAPDPYSITVSAGICDLNVASEPGDLLRLADGALYWSKAHGRNQAWIYDPAVIDELSAQERAEHLQRSQAMLGLRALAKAIDAKDSQTREHSERVAALAERLALAAGWSPDRGRLLADAALVHDVGKIGVPDAILRKPGALTAEERLQVTGHAELSARIVEGVLLPEQVAWVRTHHERPDGYGYPEGLLAEEISEGAALLAVADSFDVMTISRPYSNPKSVAEAVSEVVSLIGRQFTGDAVAALVALYADGELPLAGESVLIPAA